MRAPHLGKVLAKILTGALLVACGDYYGQNELVPAKPSVSGNRPPPGNPVVIGVTQSQCPELEFSIVAPTNLTVGNSALLFTRAIDPEGGTLAYYWSASGGTIVGPSEATSTFTCTAPGAYDIYVTVSNGACDSVSGVVAVTCK